MFYIFLLLVILGGIAFWFMNVYNNLQTMMQSIRESLSNLQAALKKRTDLANQIVDIAKGYGDHEKVTYMSVAQGHQTFQNMQMLAQSFPDLKANQTYQNLMNKLEDLESLILNRRENYNASVKKYNSARNRFPAILIAQRLSFGIAPYYEIEDPDFMEKVKVFERDDSEALQQLLENSSRAIGHKVQHTQEVLKQKIDEGADLVKAKTSEYQAKHNQNIDNDDEAVQKETGSETDKSV